MSEKINVHLYDNLPTSLESDIGRVMYIEQYCLDALNTHEKKSYVDALAYDPRLEYLHKLISRQIDLKNREFDNSEIVNAMLEVERGNIDEFQYRWEQHVDRHVRNDYHQIQRVNRFETTKKLLELLRLS